MPSPLKPCRGGCGTDLLAPDAPIHLFNVCLPCIENSPPVDPQQAWRAVKELRINRGLDPQNLSELADEEAGYRNVVVEGAETASEIESRYGEPYGIPTIPPKRTGHRVMGQ